MWNPRRTILALPAVMALAYATLAGFHTLSDLDIWWQLASGRWMWEHGAILRQETFSYTAAGAPWTYPAGAEILLYLTYRLGGFVLLSLLTPLTCLAIGLLLVRKGGWSRAAALAVAAPLIAWRCNVRADMFTTLFAAIFVAVLWEDHHNEHADRRWLWILPPLLAIWANLHPGFLLGLALMAAFTLRHPRRLLPCTIAAALATLLNPFGWRVYSWIGTLASVLPLPPWMQAWLGAGSHPANEPFIDEFSRTAISRYTISDAMRWRDPDSALWWLMALALAAVIVGLFRRQLWGTLLLIAAIAVALVAGRFQAVFAIVTVVVAPDLLKSREDKARSTLAPIGALLLLAFVAVRVTDLATNRYYAMHSEIAAFGLGVSGWFPERASQFVRANHLPRETYNDYNAGAYLTWSLAPDHPVFIDGRGYPYGSDLFVLQLRLAKQDLDSNEWRNVIAKYKIHSALIPIPRFSGGLTIFSFCSSPAFRLAYLDDTAAVFIDKNSPLARQTTLDCRTTTLTPPPASASAWDRHEFYSNASKFYAALDRDWEAAQAVREGLALVPEDPALHLDLGRLLRSLGRLDEAEREIRLANHLRPTAFGWYLLGDLLMQREHPAEAFQCFREAAGRAGRPHEAWLAAARAALAAQRPREALDAADRALAASPYVGAAASVGSSFTASALAARAAALLQVNQSAAAIEALESAARVAVEPAAVIGVHVALADAYYQAGRIGDARRVLYEAVKLGAAGPRVDLLEKELEAK